MTEDGPLSWRVRGRSFAHDRPLRARDLTELGGSAPAGPVLCVRVADLTAKQATLAEHAAAFTVTHFHGFPAVLLRVDELDEHEVVELVEQAWLAKAPKRLAARWVAG